MSQVERRGRTYDIIRFGTQVTSQNSAYQVLYEQKS
jgi:hypothetical protein